MDSFDTTKNKEIVIMYGDSEIGKVPFEYSNLSSLMRTAFENADSEENVFVVNPEFGKSESAVRSVVEFLMEHKGVASEINQPLDSKVMSENVNLPWDATFVDSLYTDDIRSLTNVMEAAFYLGIDNLIDLIGAKIASLIKDLTGKDVEAVLTPKSVVRIFDEVEVEVEEEEKDDE